MTYQEILTHAQALAPELTKIRRDLHRHAELGWLEMRTTSLIARYLTDLGYEIKLGRDVCKDDERMGLPTEEELSSHYEWAKEHGADPEFLPATRGGFTGVVATLDCGEGPTIALRFDIDALGVQENDTDAHLPHREGFDSITKGVMHACGHDGHTAIGLGTAKLLMELKNELHGTVKLIFQPAEEGVRGAKSVVAAGHLDGANYALASHIFPSGRAGGFAAYGMLEENAPGMLATAKLNATFHGRPAHAGITPQEGRNALLAAATAVLNLHAIPRYGNTPTHMNVGTLHAGTGRNVVCDTATLELEVRGQTTEANDYMYSRSLEILDAAAKMHGCTLETRAMGSAASMECTFTFSEKVEKICKEELHVPMIRISALGGGSEDFAYMARHVQEHGGEATFVALFCTCPAKNHNSSFDFAEQALPYGAAMFASVTKSLLQNS